MPISQKPNLPISDSDSAVRMRAVTRSSVFGREARYGRHEAPAAPHLALQMGEALTASVATGERLVWTMEQLLESVPVSRSTIYRWIEREGLPVVRIGKSSSPLFLPQNVLRWFESWEQQNKAVSGTSQSTEVSPDALRLSELRKTAHTPTRRSRRTPPPPIAAAGSRERLRRIHGAR